MENLRRPKHIVALAWNITVQNRAILFKLGFIPSFFSILVTAWYIFYQIQSWRHSPWFSDDSENEFLLGFLLDVWSVVSSNISLLIGSALFLIIVLLGWFFVPMICRAAIIDLTGKYWRGEPMEKGVSSGVFHFFPMFTMNAFTGSLQPTTFYTEFSFLVRHIPQAASLILPPLLFLGSVGLITLFFLPFATQAIMLKDRKFITAITDSFKLVVENPGRTIKIMLIFILVELRVVLNVLLVLALPFVIAAATGLFASFFSEQIGMLLAICLFFVLVLTAAYLTGILFVFTEVVWTVAFLVFSGEEPKFEMVKKEEAIKPTAVTSDVLVTP
jgi:hypothetical protein